MSKIISYTLSTGELIENKTYSSQAIFEYNLLNHIDDSEIEEYAENYLDMVDGDDPPINFWTLDTDELISEIESRGYEIAEKETAVELDYKDSHMLQEIIDKFYNSSLTEREEIWKRIGQK